MLRFLSLKLAERRTACAVLCVVSVCSGIFLCFTGCKVGPEYAGPPMPPVQQEWTQSNREEVRSQMPALDDWWTVFDDPVLNTILANVNEQNLSLRAAAWKIYQARADLCATRGDMFPALGTDASYSWTRTGKNLRTPSQSMFSQTWNWGLSASWELDIFGQIQRCIEAAEAEVDATTEDYRNVKMVLLADTARTYIDARLYQERMGIVKANLDDRRAYLQLLKRKFSAGRDSALPSTQGEADLKTVEATYAALQHGYRTSLNRLSVLMGCPPGTVDEIMAKVEPVPVAPEALAVGVPADLLRRRPDIRALERRLAAQTARIGIAEAEKYPKFYINGSFGWQANDVGDLLNVHNSQGSLTPMLTWRLFEFGKIRCTIMKQEGLTEEMKYEYQEAVLTAAEEVDNAISNFVRLHEQADSLEEALRQYKYSLHLSRRLYEEGKTDYMSVLDSQRQLLQYAEELATVRANIASSLVQLYRALGGGWQVDPAASSTTQQIDRFRNRAAGLQYSTPGETVNSLGSARSRADVTPEINTPSQYRLTVGELIRNNDTLVPEPSTPTTKPTTRAPAKPSAKKSIVLPKDAEPALEGADPITEGALLTGRPAAPVASMPEFEMESFPNP